MTGGKLGELPDWRAVIQAAKVLGVEPWRLAGIEYRPGEPVPVFWIHWALEYERVEVEAANQLRLEAEAQKRTPLGT